MLREEDALRHMIIAHARDNILFFTNRGKVYQTKAYQIPEFERTAQGIPLINVIDLDPKETVTAVLAAPDFENNDFLVMATRQGEIKKTSLHDFAVGPPQRPHGDGPRAERRAVLGQALRRRART